MTTIQELMLKITGPIKAYKLIFNFNRLYIYVHHWDMLNKDQRQCITNLVEVTVVLESTKVMVRYDTGTLLIQTPALVSENDGVVTSYKLIEV